MQQSRHQVQLGGAKVQGQMPSHVLCTAWLVAEEIEPEGFASASRSKASVWLYQLMSSSRMAISSVAFQKIGHSCWLRSHAGVALIYHLVGRALADN